MCGHPRKIKFQYYNINLQNYDSSIYHQARDHFEQYGTGKEDNNGSLMDKASPHVDFLEDLKDTEQRNGVDFHRFERDETLGNFLVRIAQ